MRWIFRAFYGSFGRREKKLKFCDESFSQKCSREKNFFITFCDKKWKSDGVIKTRSVLALIHNQKKFLPTKHFFQIPTMDNRWKVSNSHYLLSFIGTKKHSNQLVPQSFPTNYFFTPLFSAISDFNVNICSAEC